MTRNWPLIFFFFWHGFRSSLSISFDPKIFYHDDYTKWGIGKTTYPHAGQ